MPNLAIKQSVLTYLLLFCNDQAELVDLLSLKEEWLKSSTKTPNERQTGLF